MLTIDSYGNEGAMNLGAMVELRVRDENIFSFDMWSLRQGKAKSARNHGIKNTLGLG